MKLAAMALAALALATAGPTAAQSDTDAETLTELAYVLGQSHAIRQACVGEGDQFWRARMSRLLDVDVHDTALAGRLADRFNAGYAEGQARYTGCDQVAKAAGARLAARGRELSSALARP